MDKFDGITAEQLVGVMLQEQGATDRTLEIEAELKARYARMQSFTLTDFASSVVLACTRRPENAYFGTYIISEYAGSLNPAEQSWLWAKIGTDAKLAKVRDLARVQLMAIWHYEQSGSLLPKIVAAVQERLTPSAV